MLRIRPTAAGLAFFLLPPLLLYRGFSQTGIPALIAGIGLPSLVILSLLFLLSGIHGVKIIARSPELRGSAVPETGIIGFPLLLKTDPRRGGFLPGNKLSVHWKMHFGPFRYHTAAPLPVKGTGSALLIPPRRGGWQGRSFLRSEDPFGFFHFDYQCGSEYRISVPPAVVQNDVSEIRGRPAADAAAAPRLKEDTEERLERRSYIPGDDPRRLDWKVFARTGEMFVRVGEEVVPDRGRVWLMVVSDDFRGFRKGIQVNRLDALLEAASALVRQLEKGNMDIRVLLPGEDRWAGTDSGWEGRLSRCLPSRTFLSENTVFPPPGERIWIVAHPGSGGGRSVAGEAANRGCRVSLAYPMAAYFRENSPLKKKLYGRLLKLGESAAEAEGLDVRRI